VVNGVYQSINYGVLPVDSAAAKALGATALKPERSTNYSLGLTYQPAPQLSFTADAYVINVRDRITLTGTLLGDEVTQALLDNGIDSTSGGRYFTNGANTRTKGLDLVGNFDQNLGNWGQLKWTAAFNWNQTQILSYKENVTIQGTDYSLMDRQARNFLTEVQPHTKLILGANWQRERWTSNLTLTRYGSWREVNSATDRSLDREYKARWITDIDVGYQLTKDLNLAVGAQNLFDVYPERQNPSSKTMTKGYGAYSPYGFTGGYYFTRLTYNF
jgi:iron complex outermembrane receptor protein